MKKTLSLILAVALVFALAVPVLAVDEPTHLTVGVIGEPMTLDCEQGGENGMGTYETLFRTDAEGNIIYKLATGYEWEDDNTLVINLREGVKFHNGNDFTASDVLFSLVVCANNPQMQNRVAVLDMDNCVARDDYTVELKTKSYSAVLVDYLNTIMMIDEDWYTENDGKIDQICNGTGPYIMQEWKMGDRLILQRFDDYWGDAPYFESVDVVFFNDASTAFFEFETGNLDVVEVFNAEDVEVMNSGAVEGYLVSSLSHHETVVSMSTIVGDTFKSENLRKAIAYGIDIDTMITAICGEMDIPATSLLPSDDMNHIDAQFEYDPELAAQYVEAYKEETGADEIVLNLVLDNEGYNPDIAEAIQFFLAEIGITVNVETIMKFDLIPRMIAGEIDFTLNSIGGGVDSNNVFMGLERGSGNSSMELTDDTICDLIAAAQVEKDPEARAGLYKEIQENNLENAWTIPLYEPVLFYAAREGFEGVHVDPVSGQDMSIPDIYFAG